MVSRLGFAIATDANADILILDEVLSVGDAAFQKKSLERIQRFRRECATICSSHMIWKPWNLRVTG